MYKILGENRKLTLIFIIIIFIFSISLGIFYMSNVNVKIEYNMIKKLIVSALAKLLSKS